MKSSDALPVGALILGVGVRSVVIVVGIAAAVCVWAQRRSSIDAMTCLAAPAMALDGLQASMVRQQRCVGDASHELRSPLESLRSYLEVSLLENGDEHRGTGRRR